MRTWSYQQFAIVAADSAQSLTDQLNNKLKELKHKNPTVTFEGMIARISYSEQENLPECLQEEYEMQGAGFLCKDCPMFKPIRKADGTIDERMKIGECPVSKYGKTRADGRACEDLFEMIANGRVKLCLAE